MKRTLNSLLVALLLAASTHTGLQVGAIVASVAIGSVVVGCHTPTQQKFAVNSIVTTHQVVDAALDSYLDLVLKNKIATNGVPTVLQAYGNYQAAYNAALVIVLGNTNAPAPASLSDAASAFTTTVTAAKKGSL